MNEQRQDEKDQKPEGVAGTNTPGQKAPDNSKEKLDKRLDEGVEESFPASDPVSVKITK